VAAVVNEVTGSQSSAGHPPSRARRLSWSELRGLVLAQAPGLSAPQAGGIGLCAVCSGPVGGRSRHCFQCDLHGQCASGGLADVVLPVTYAPKGSSHARHLWQYKSVKVRGDIGRPESGLVLLALLLVFLREHGACLWRAAGLTARGGPAGLAGPTHVAVVPTARGRPGPHPLRTLIEPYLRRPWAELSARPAEHRVRDLDPDRFTAGPVPGARVLLMDDTWTTGASAQSAAMALRRAGARSVATVVIGRHLSLGPEALRAFSPAAMPFSVGSCAVHGGTAHADGGTAHADGGTAHADGGAAHNDRDVGG
jgi:hypothetical protein